MTTSANPITFLKTAIKDRQVAAIASSSKFVIQKVIKKLPKNTKTIIEYGPGNGALTKKLLKVLPKDGKLLVIESNQQFANNLKKLKDPRLIVIHSRVEATLETLSDLGFNQVDAVVSSIPFSFLQPEVRQTIVAHTYKILAPGGRFIVFHQYKRLIIPTLYAFFEDVHTSFEILNVFPCFIFNAQKGC